MIVDGADLGPALDLTPNEERALAALRADTLQSWDMPLIDGVYRRALAIGNADLVRELDAYRAGEAPEPAIAPPPSAPVTENPFVVQAARSKRDAGPRANGRDEIKRLHHEILIEAKNPPERDSFYIVNWALE